ncbi:MAG: hypothetical protein ACI9WU_002915 [Myxococcota bacterium]|jgi:hypothetical protein
MKTKWLVALSIVALTGFIAACSSEGGTNSSSTGSSGGTDGNASVDGTGTTDGVDNTAGGVTDQTDGGDTAVNLTPIEAGPECGFNADQQGKILGRHIKNFGLKTYEGNPYWLHGNCGHTETPKKAVWVILATGW